MSQEPNASPIKTPPSVGPEGADSDSLFDDLAAFGELPAPTQDGIHAASFSESPEVAAAPVALVPVSVPGPALVPAPAAARSAFVAPAASKPAAPASPNSAHNMADIDSIKAILALPTAEKREALLAPMSAGDRAKVLAFMADTRLSPDDPAFITAGLMGFIAAVGQTIPATIQGAADTFIENVNHALNNYADIPELIRSALLDFRGAIDEGARAYEEAAVRVNEAFVARLRRDLGEDLQNREEARSAEDAARSEAIAAELELAKARIEEFASMSQAELAKGIQATSASWVEIASRVTGAPGAGAPRSETARRGQPSKPKSFWEYQGAVGIVGGAVGLGALLASTLMIIFK